MEGDELDAWDVVPLTDTDTVEVREVETETDVDTDVVDADDAPLVFVALLVEDDADEEPVPVELNEVLLIPIVTELKIVELLPELFVIELDLVWLTVEVAGEEGLYQ